MTVRIRSITFDCADPYLLAGFWSQVTGFREASNSNHPDDPEGLLVAPDGSINLLFVRAAQGSRARTVFTWTSPPRTPRLARGTPRSSGSWAWAPPWSMISGGPTPRAGWCSPTLKATSSALSAASLAADTR